MSFIYRNGWLCQFLDEDLQTSLPRKLHFRTEDKIREIARRGDGMLNLESLQAFDQAVEIGRGGVWLELTDEQYRTLLSA